MSIDVVNEKSPRRRAFFGLPKYPRWSQRPAVFLVHIHDGLRQPARQTGMQLHTGTYAKLLYTASPLPSLRFLRQWYSLRKEGW